MASIQGTIFDKSVFNEKLYSVPSNKSFKNNNIKRTYCSD